MKRFANKNRKLLLFLRYPIIIVSIFLMIGIIFIFLLNAYFYVTKPKQTIEITQGAPPVAPVIPYFPQLFGMESFFPNFYFIYFIIAFSIVALFHELAHGLYMVLYKVKIKSTGFLFLGPILGAFVEQDDEKFRKKSNIEQMTILGAGVFINFLLFIFFMFILYIFFISFYQPAGYAIIDYPKTLINVSQIENYTSISNNLTLIKTKDGSNFVLPNKVFYSLKNNLTGYEKIIVYYYAPLIVNDVKGYITSIDGKEVKNSDDVYYILKEKKPGDNIFIKTEFKGEERKYSLKLEENPRNSSLGFMGIELISRKQIVDLNKNRNFLSKILSKIFSLKDPLVLYKPTINKEVAEYIYYLIWWCMIINFFVALFNMLPFGIFDGGRFNYLLILSLTKSDDRTKKIYNFISSIVILSFLLILLSWFFSRIIFR
ncbi:MAG: site-2 protease family protein [Candidatus Pacearchaeota archaeon]